MKNKICVVGNFSEGFFKHIRNLKHIGMIVKIVGYNLTIKQIYNWREVLFRAEQCKFSNICYPILIGKFFAVIIVGAAGYADNFYEQPYFKFLP